MVDDSNTVWIATGAGVLKKKNGSSTFDLVFPASDLGPGFAVAMDRSTIWMGTWKGVYIYKNGKIQNMPGTSGPISTLCVSAEGVYALGPDGIWLFKSDKCVRKNFKTARSIRDAVSDGKGGLWIASDVGLYHCTDSGSTYIHKTDQLISAVIKGLAFDGRGRLWAAGLGGVSILDQGKKESYLRPEQGIPSSHVNSVRMDLNGDMWVGTEVGVVRYKPDGSHSLRFSRRWLLDDNVNAIAFDREGNAWLATSQGVSAIKKRKMDLSAKADHFYDILMKRHIREPWTAGSCHLQVLGDTASWRPDDDDNDGEITGNYLMMESLRFAATGNEDARVKARKAFHFLKQLQEVTGGDGYFARSIVPVDWKFELHDTNRTYTPQQVADEKVKEPRYKVIEERWRKSVDGQRLWKGDASSDEWCGHMAGYFFYYQLAADDAEKEVIRKHVALLVDHLIKNNFNMMDIDGTHTRWSVWSPNELNRDPEWNPDRAQNSMELLAFLKLAYFMTGDMKYQNQYLRLIKKEKYLENMSAIKDQNPAWFIYYDLGLQVYLYPIFMSCEKDPVLLDFYKKHLEDWMSRRRGDENPLFNFFYCYASGRREELKRSVGLLMDTPLDLVDWTIDHTRREDVKLVRRPVLDDIQVDQLPPASIRATIRWDRNPWAAINGYPDMEKEPDFWLLPYWLGRYLKMIQ